MHLLKSRAFILCCVLFIIHQVTQKGFGIPIRYIDSYLDNFLAMPIILTILLTEKRILSGNYEIVFSVKHIILITLYISAISELVFPRLSTNFTADPADLLFYAAGSLVYHGMQGTFNKFETRTQGRFI